MRKTLFALAAVIVAQSLVAQEPVASKKNAVWDLISTQNDVNKDGKVTTDEFTRGKTRFERLDRDKDGVLTVADFKRRERRGARGGRGGRRGGGRGMSASMLFGRLMDTDENQEVTKKEVNSWVKEHDKNNDGKLNKDEFGNSRRGEFIIGMLDKDEDSMVSLAEFTTEFDKAAGEAGVIKVTARRRGNRGGSGGRARPADGAPKVGVVAPEIHLSYKDGKSKAKLSSFKGKKPVALIFGSYT